MYPLSHNLKFLVKWGAESCSLKYGAVKVIWSHIYQQQKVCTSSLGREENFHSIDKIKSLPQWSRRLKHCSSHWGRTDEPTDNETQTHNFQMATQNSASFKPQSQLAWSDHILTSFLTVRIPGKIPRLWYQIN